MANRIFRHQRSLSWAKAIAGWDVFLQSSDVPWLRKATTRAERLRDGLKQIIFRYALSVGSHRTWNAIHSKRSKAHFEKVATTARCLEQALLDAGASLDQPTDGLAGILENKLALERRSSIPIQTLLKELDARIQGAKELADLVKVQGQGSASNRRMRRNFLRSLGGWWMRARPCRGKPTTSNSEYLNFIEELNDHVLVADMALGTRANIRDQILQIEGSEKVSFLIRRTR